MRAPRDTDESPRRNTHELRTGLQNEIRPPILCRAEMLAEFEGKLLDTAPPKRGTRGPPTLCHLTSVGLRRRARSWAI